MVGLVGVGPFEGDGSCGVEADEPGGCCGFGEQCFVLLGFDGDDRPAEGSCDDDPDEECSYGHGSILSSDDGLLAQSMLTKGRMVRMGRMIGYDQRVFIPPADRDYF